MITKNKMHASLENTHLTIHTFTHFSLKFHKFLSRSNVFSDRSCIVDFSTSFLTEIIFLFLYPIEAIVTGARQGSTCLKHI